MCYLHSRQFLNVLTTYVRVVWNTAVGEADGPDVRVGEVVHLALQLYQGDVLHHLRLVVGIVNVDTIQEKYSNEFGRVGKIYVVLN